MIPTKAGVNLVTVLPELLTSPKLTADWEQRLNEVAKGQASPEDFMDGIEAMAAELVRKYSHISEDGQKLFQPEKGDGGPLPPAVASRSMRARRTSPVRTVPVSLSCGRMTVSGPAAARK